MTATGFAGIDVSFSKTKRLAVCVCRMREGHLEPLKLKQASDVGLPPMGQGNCKTVDREELATFADEVVSYLTTIEKRFQIKIDCIAIDAPRTFAPEGGKRACERAMDDATPRISYYKTPSRTRFCELRDLAKKHCAEKRDATRLAGANQLWMLVGFKLFERLCAAAYKCIETYPNAILHSLGKPSAHKSKVAGFNMQLKQVRDAIGVPASIEELDSYCYGDRHDKLDALMAAWVASLEAGELCRYGDSDHDGIWVPRRLSNRR